MRRGAFIVLEGIDRCGKTTQSTRLRETLTNLGHPTTALRFPDRTTTIGKLIDAYLAQGKEIDDRAIHLLFSANRWELAAQLEAQLRGGDNVVVDRYCYSGIAFTSAKGLPLEWCKAPEVGLPR
jgi:dTMP kinase